MRQVQQPVRDLGGNRVLGGTVEALILPPRLELADEICSSLGAMIGRRGGFFEDSPRLSSCITTRHSVTDMEIPSHAKTTEGVEL